MILQIMLNLFLNGKRVDLTLLFFFFDKAILFNFLYII